MSCSHSPASKLFARAATGACALLTPPQVGPATAAAYGLCSRALWRRSTVTRAAVSLAAVRTVEGSSSDNNNNSNRSSGNSSSNDIAQRQLALLFDISCNSVFWFWRRSFAVRLHNRRIVLNDVTLWESPSGRGLLKSSNKESSPLVKVSQTQKKEKNSCPIRVFAPWFARNWLASQPASQPGRLQSTNDCSSCPSFVIELGVRSFCSPEAWGRIIRHTEAVVFVLLLLVPCPEPSARPPVRPRPPVRLIIRPNVLLLFVCSFNHSSVRQPPNQMDVLASQVCNRKSTLSLCLSIPLWRFKLLTDTQPP